MAQKVRIGKDVYIGLTEGGYVKWYKNNNFDNYMFAYSLGYNLCSNVTLQGMYIHPQMEDKYEILKQLLPSKTLITSVQNVSKNEYKTFLGLGFKDYFRMPGNYVSSPYGSSTSQKKRKS